MSAIIVSLPSAEMTRVLWILSIATGECGDVDNYSVSQEARRKACTTVRGSRAVILYL